MFGGYWVWPGVSDDMTVACSIEGCFVATFFILVFLRILYLHFYYGKRYLDIYDCICATQISLSFYVLLSVIRTVRRRKPLGHKAEIVLHISVWIVAIAVGLIPLYKPYYNSHYQPLECGWCGIGPKYFWCRFTNYILEWIIMVVENRILDLIISQRLLQFCTYLLG